MAEKSGLPTDTGVSVRTAGIGDERAMGDPNGEDTEKDMLDWSWLTCSESDALSSSSRRSLPSYS